ncbi:hypothetical protein [Aquabacterium sp. J223]|uniref:hypothetical protein n=1 Tax=Aquabacterium sp. J223 TaxID=2898431 RepID=UPI0021AE13E2|nr:hypothetical protein [Aquabacterium sp. J223]UUX94560.1 hypothetical protein LRS07_14770 [Aquabacterium sp. J223]
MSPDVAFLAGAAQLPLYTLRWGQVAADAGFRRDGLYLVRPDGHVALATTQLRLDPLEGMLTFTEPAAG